MGKKDGASVSSEHDAKSNRAVSRTIALNRPFFLLRITSQQPHAFLALPHPAHKVAENPYCNLTQRDF
jgi:hypothetical protein